MDVKQVYELVKNGLTGVEDNFKALAFEKSKSFPELHKMLSHILCGGGKVVRPLLAFHSGSLFNYNHDKLIYMASASELMHIATLVHDDAIDKANMRRGRATINSIWGVDRAIIFGDYLFAKAAQFAVATGSLRVVGLFAETLEAISHGELRQGFSAYKLNQTFDEYLERITGKTAALFALATEGGAVLGEASEDSIKSLRDFGINLGISFQIVDDILDFTASEKELGKPVASDLVQGTMTLPSMMLLERFPGDNPVRRIFNNEGDSHENVKEAIALLNSSGIIEECYKMASQYSEKARRNLDTMPDTKNRQALIALADFVVRRSK
ncbi:MAG: polyprenyl synthetase family protein [Dehalococcoidales bacterium]|nr:polyprenyl synthetase family protein [Dehalococcoidales bacterium]